jgi:flagellar motor protein MotB
MFAYAGSQHVEYFPTQLTAAHIMQPEQPSGQEQPAVTQPDQQQQQKQQQQQQQQQQQPQQELQQQLLSWQQQQPQQQQQQQQQQQPHPNLYLLKKLSREISELDVGDTVDIISDPDPATFLREYVASNKPLLIKGAIDHWPAMRQWTPSVLQAKAGQLQVSAATTPNGLADAVTPVVTEDYRQEACFCLPHTQRMAFGEFLSLFFEGRQGVVPYLQVSSGALAAACPDAAGISGVLRECS